MPHVGDAVTSLCEQVPIGRATTSNRTACQPTLGKKLSLQLRKNRFAMEKPFGWGLVLLHDARCVVPL